MLVQLGLRERRGAPSRVALPICGTLAARRSRFPAGELACARRAASSIRVAFRKLAEVQLRLNRTIAAGERCVDLGSSPGSWAWLALQEGAAVTAIDRSPLREDLMRHPRLHFVRGDAFKYVSRCARRLVLCDVIAFPQRSIELLATWLRQRWCRQFCVTIKFRGQDDYGRLTECKNNCWRQRAPNTACAG